MRAVPLTPELHELARRVSNWGRWGPDDQRGTLNLIDSDAILRGRDAIRTGRSFSLAIPFDETGPHMFLVAGGKAQRVFVTLGLDHGDQVEVRGKLPAGAQVAVEGAYELQDGMAVKVRGK